MIIIIIIVIKGISIIHNYFLHFSFLFLSILSLYLSLLPLTFLSETTALHPGTQPWKIVKMEWGRSGTMAAGGVTPPEWQNVYSIRAMLGFLSTCQSVCCGPWEHPRPRCRKGENPTPRLQSPSTLWPRVGWQRLARHECLPRDFMENASTHLRTS